MDANLANLRYIKDKDEELGSRLNLQPKQVRSALAELLAEGFAAKVLSRVKSRVKPSRMSKTIPSPRVENQQPEGNEQLSIGDGRGTTAL